MGYYSNKGIRGAPDVDGSVAPSDNDSLVYDASSGLWKPKGLDYLSVTPPAGVASSAVKGCWQFDGSANHLKDRTANGTDLTESSTAKTGIMPGTNKYAESFMSGYVYSLTPDAGLYITGALTIEIVANAFTPAANYLISMGANAGTEADNILYSIVPYASSYNRTYYISESGSGDDETKVLNTGILVGSNNLYTLTRAADGALNFYTNGVLLDTQTSTPPTGGTSGDLIIGASEAAASPFAGAMMSVRISNVEFTEAQVLEAAKQVGLA